MTILSPNNQPRPRPTRRAVVLAAVAAVVLAGGGYAIGHATTPAAASKPSGASGMAGMSGSMAAGASSGSSNGAQPTCTPSPSPSMSMDSPEASLSEMIGRETGTALAGRAPLTVNDTQLLALGNQAPSNATVDTCADRVTFATTTVALVVEAVPPNNPDMTFRIAGLVNPTVVVPRGADVDIEFVNGDDDEAHAFVITADQPPFGFHPAAAPAFPGSATGPIGDPTATGHGAREFAFTATTPGTYQYLCPMPGHAAMGMHGTFTVQ